MKKNPIATAGLRWTVNDMRLKVVDYDAMRAAFDEEFKKTYQLIQDGETHLDNLAEGFHEADGVIWSLPTIDAVPVVRCAKCVYLDSRGRCIKSGLYMADSGFCSYGERSADND